MLAKLFLIACVIAVALCAGSGNPNGALGSATVDDIRVQKCAKCMYMEGGLPMNLQNYLKIPGLPDNNARCKRWNDGIPESAYETCSEPFDGEANSCMFLNMTITIKNVVTETAGAIGNAINGTLNGGAAGAIGQILGGVTNRPNIPFVNRLPSFSFGRKKRQAGNVFGNVVNGAIGAASGAVGNIIPGGIKLPDFIPTGNGTYTYKIFYKGCVKLSLLETLAGSNCRLDPEFRDIQFFSQQTLLQPFMDLVDTLNSGLSGFAGTSTKVDGLCYIVKKEFTRKIWKALLHYDPEETKKAMGLENIGK